MTDEAPRPPSVFRRLQEPAALNYVIMTGVALLVYGMVMVPRGNDAGALIAILLAVAGILARWTAAPILILLLTIYQLMDPGFMNLLGWIGGGRWYVDRSTGGFNIEDLLLGGALLAYIIGHFRLTSLVHQGMPDEPTSRREVDPADPPRRPAGTVAPDELTRTLVVAAGCAVAGQVAWTVLKLVEQQTRPSVFMPATARFLLVVWVAGLAIMIASAALVYLRASAMTRREAALVLRDEFFQENRRETDRLSRWRKWYKERVAMRRRAGK